MHRSGRSATLNLRNHFGGHSVMVALIRLRRDGKYEEIVYCNWGRRSC
jgi:hypothetical protein